MERDLPNKINIQQTYDEYRPVFQEILSKIEASLKKSIHISSTPTYKNRIKSFSSYYKKILRQKPKEAAESKTLVTLTDMMGIRVICAFLEDLEIVEKQLEEVYDVKEIERKGAQQSFREFGYESVHVLIAIPEDCKPDDTSVYLPPDLVCEIQIRTILQDAWAEVEHELIYKSEFNPFDKPLRRKLASINASLTLADTIFQEIRDYQNRLVSELGCRRNTFYDKADELTDKELGTTRENQMVTQTFVQPNTKSGSIDDLVLQALHEHNQGNFMQAVQIYTQILQSKPEPPDIVKAVILKHRGMAFFAQNVYDEALKDFQSSEKFDPKGFRTIYYEGIVKSVQGHDSEAIECYNRSLSIDPYQSHVYYRRAISYFVLGDYTTAMKDITSAEQLGLNDDDLKALKSKVIKKFDMGM